MKPSLDEPDAAWHVKAAGGRSAARLHTAAQVLLAPRDGPCQPLLHAGRHGRAHHGLCTQQTWCTADLPRLWLAGWTQVHPAPKLHAFMIMAATWQKASLSRECMD